MFVPLTSLWLKMPTSSVAPPASVIVRSVVTPPAGVYSSLRMFVPSKQLINSTRSRVLATPVLVYRVTPLAILQESKRYLHPDCIEAFATSDEVSALRSTPRAVTVNTCALANDENRLTLGNIAPASALGVFSQMNSIGPPLQTTDCPVPPNRNVELYKITVAAAVAKIFEAMAVFKYNWHESKRFVLAPELLI